MMFYFISLFKKKKKKKKTFWVFLKGLLVFFSFLDFLSTSKLLVDFEGPNFQALYSNELKI